MTLLEELAQAARATVDSGYYGSGKALKRGPSLTKAILESPHDPALIAEIKPASPTMGKMPKGGLPGLMPTFLSQGACALSILTEPHHFHGSLANLRLGVATKAPTLMKDFIVDERQIDCAAREGASAVLLIASLHDAARLAQLVEYAHLAEREVLLECATKDEVHLALESEADLVGINNRDLRTFRVDPGTTARLLEGVEADRPVVSLSGFATRADVVAVRGRVDAVLVGSSLMEGRTTVQELLGG